MTLHGRRLGGYWGPTTCRAIPSLPKHNLSMLQRLFSSQIEDTQEPASNQTWAPIMRTAVRMRALSTAALERRGLARMSKQSATMPAAKTNNINPHRRTMLLLFAILLLLKKQRGFLERAANSKFICGGTVQIPAMMRSIFSFVMSYRSSTSKQVFFSFVGIPIASKANCMATGFFAGSGLQTKALSSTLLCSAHW